jgi:hypothetical protein
MPQLEAITSSGALREKRIIRNKAGKKERVEVVHSVGSARSNYHYVMQYPPDVTDAILARDNRALRKMADEQDAKQAEYDALINQTIQSSGLSALVGNCHIHIERPFQCKVLLNLWLPDFSMWVSHEWEAALPSQLPASDVITKFATDYLDDIATD